uniref:Cytochrome b5 reductase 4 n=1 Tax=Gouania willdenowi TaxID=441366 RepID=A0A8C5ET21_GOUWI
MLNVPTQSFPAPSSQQRVAPSGQSGRNKVALKPGHSLMDWIRYSKSGKDLTGLKGRLIEVTQEELEKHNTRGDCWTCIRGMVYNVTAYMEYHPGGEEELMKAAGADGTELFDQVHRWVNYESMLKECLVGRMATKITTAMKGTQSEDVVVYDWFQTEGSVHLVIYAKRKIPSSGCTTADLQAGVLRLEVLLGKMSYLLHLFHSAHTVGKIQVSIRKQSKGSWARLGQPLESHNTFVRKKDRALFYRECVLVSKTEVNYNTNVFRFKFPRGSVMHVPVGQHVYLKANIQDTEVVRAYTAVDQHLISASGNSSQESDLYLMIKIYPDGIFTPYLHSLQIGDHMSVSGPDGTFSLRRLLDGTNLYLLAAGTGFTPMVRLIRLVLEDTETVREAKLLFFNRREEDILLHHELHQLAANNPRFQVEHVLSEPCGSWSGRRGRVDESMLKDFITPEDSKRYVCVCGPKGFTNFSVRDTEHIFYIFIH